MSEKFAEDWSNDDAARPTGSARSLTVAHRLLPCLVLAVLVSAAEVPARASPSRWPPSPCRWCS